MEKMKCRRHKTKMIYYQIAEFNCYGHYCPQCEEEAKKEAKRLFPIYEIKYKKREYKELFFTCARCGEQKTRTSNKQYLCGECRKFILVLFKDKKYLSPYLTRRIDLSSINQRKRYLLTARFTENFELLNDYEKYLLRKLNKYPAEKTNRN